MAGWLAGGLKGGILNGFLVCVEGRTPNAGRRTPNAESRPALPWWVALPGFWFRGGALLREVLVGGMYVWCVRYGTVLLYCTAVLVSLIRWRCVALRCRVFAFRRTAMVGVAPDACHPKTDNTVEFWIVFDLRWRCLCAARKTLSGAALGESSQSLARPGRPSTSSP